MFGKLTKVKILILIGLVIGFLVKIESIIDYIKPYDETTPDENTKILVKTKDIGEKTDKFKLKSKIAIIVLNLGLENRQLELSKTLDKKISFGFSIYGNNLSQITGDALAEGRAISILLPTQSINSSISDPGPSALLTASKVGENLRKFKSVLSKLPSNKSGLYLNYDSAFLTKKDQASNIVTMLEDYSDNFKFITYNDSDRSKFMTKLLENSTLKSKLILINSIIDLSLTKADIVESLNNLAQLSLSRNEVVIGAISPTNISITTLSQWLQSNGDTVELFSIDELLFENSKKN
jgi:polysaccharide deacetylase 2 family uncharacterized protein YibQ